MRWWFALALTALADCYPVEEFSMSTPGQVAYAEGDRDGLGTTVGGACRRLRVLGCPEGFRTRRDRTCFERMTELESQSVRCLGAASSVYDVRSCGDHDAFRIRCVMPAVDDLGSALP